MAGCAGADSVLQGVYSFDVAAQIQQEQRTTALALAQLVMSGVTNQCGIAVRPCKRTSLLVLEQPLSQPLSRHYDRYIQRRYLIAFSNSATKQALTPLSRRYAGTIGANLVPYSAT
jgi:hypothetical protein